MTLMSRVKLWAGFAYVWIRQRMPEGVVCALKSTPLLAIVRYLLSNEVAIFPLSGALQGHRLRMAKPFIWGMIYGTHEPNVCEVIGRIVRSGQRVLDVGAHIGYDTLLLAHLVGPAGRVVAFEPWPANVALLRQNVSLNGYEERVRVEPVAVADQEGQLRLHFHGHPSIPCTINMYGTDDSGLEVRAVTLDDYVKRNGETVDFIKIDVEGAGAQVLAGLCQTLEQQSPVLLMEVHTEAERACLDQLAGWQMYRVESNASLTRLSRGEPMATWPEHRILWRPTRTSARCSIELER